jgi:hypothetical protein
VWQKVAIFLNVRVVSVNGLPKVDLIENPDPCVFISLSRTYTVHSTTVRCNALSAKWNESFVFPLWHQAAQVLSFVLANRGVTMHRPLDTLIVPLAQIQLFTIYERTDTFQSRHATIRYALQIIPVGAPPFKNYCPPDLPPPPYIFRIRFLPPIVPSVTVTCGSEIFQGEGELEFPVGILLSFNVNEGGITVASAVLDPPSRPYSQPYDFWLDLRPPPGSTGIRLHLLAEVASASAPHFEDSAIICPLGDPVPRQLMHVRLSFGPSWVAADRFAASSEYTPDGRVASHAFGIDDDAFWASDGTTVMGQWLEAVCSRPARLNRLLLKARRDTDVQQSPREFEILAGGQGSLVTLALFKTPPWRLGETRTFEFLNDKEYSRYRVVFRKSDSNHVAVSKVRFGYELEGTQ